MPPPGHARPRFRFGKFTVSTARRALLRDGEEVPLIPRYFDLLVLLLERRHEAVHRREILEVVWSDVVVSDGALSQAVRTLRRTLEDDSREPIFIRTVSRHGYRFVHAGVIEETDDLAAVPAVASASVAAPPSAAPRSDPFEEAIGRLLSPAASPEGEGAEDVRRAAAETLHALGTEVSLRRLDQRPGHEAGRAILRDARWDVPGAGMVPLIGHPGGFTSMRILIGLRMRRAARIAGSRWTAAAGGGAAAGVAAGFMGGMVIYSASETAPSPRLPLVFALVGAIIGGLGAAGVGAGLAVAEALARSMRGAALVALGALGGGTIGLVAHTIGRWTLEGIFGHDLSPVGGALEGLAIGGAAGLGYALSTPRPGGGGMATPRGWSRLSAAAVTGGCCALAGMIVTALGGNLGGVSLDYMARSFHGSEVGLAPLARLFGERDLGPITRGVLSAYEGLLFGAGLTLGLTRRPR
jgi:DNA-binding winged helix-turn-helix (wHTH) protein